MNKKTLKWLQLKILMRVHYNAIDKEIDFLCDIHFKITRIMNDNITLGHIFKNFIYFLEYINSDIATNITSSCITVLLGNGSNVI